MIATTTLGAEVGYALLWLIISELRGETGRSVGNRPLRYRDRRDGAEAFNSVPGPRIAGVNWVVISWFIMAVITFFQIGAMYGGVAQVFNLVIPAVSTTVWIFIEMVVTLIILLGGHYERIEKLATLRCVSSRCSPCSALPC